MDKSLLPSREYELIPIVSLFRLTTTGSIVTFMLPQSLREAASCPVAPNDQNSHNELGPQCLVRNANWFSSSSVYRAANGQMDRITSV